MDFLEAEAWRRAAKGTERPVFHNGAIVGHVREFSDTLLIFLLKANRPRKYRDMTGAGPSDTAARPRLNIPDRDARQVP